MSGKAIRQQMDIVEVVTRAQGGDRQAYSELYEHFQPGVYAIALAYLRDAHAAQGLTHDVLLQVFVKLDQSAAPTGGLCGVVTPNGSAYGDQSYIPPWSNGE